MEYSYKTFPIRLEDGAIPEEVRQWNLAVSAGFYGEEYSADHAAKILALEAASGSVATGAYAAQEPALAHALSPERPVATFEYFDGTLNVGTTLLPAHQITSVTVRPTHRRRGLLRTLMTADLAGAKSNGLAMAALTASEATIYGRFGFGNSTSLGHISVDTRNGLRFAAAVEESFGTVEVGPASAVSEIHNEVFAKVHANTFGSISRGQMYTALAAGLFDYEKSEPSKKIRAAYHYDIDGAIDGYVSYEPVEDSTPFTVKVVDLLAATPQVYLALWNYLGSLDLVHRVTWNLAPVADPLEWALQDRRLYKRQRTEDLLWLRILDVKAALEARQYWVDGSLAFSVVDDLGHAEGSFRLTVTEGKPEVVTVDPGEAQLTLGVSELSSLYLGGVSAGTLHRAGRIQELEPRAVAEFGALLSSGVEPYCLTHF